MDDCEKVWKWEEAQRRAKSLKLEIRVYGMGFQVLPTEEFMGKRTASPGKALTTGIATIDGLLCYLAGIEAIISREEMIQSLIRVPEEVIEIDPGVAQIRRLSQNPVPNDIRSMGLDAICRCLQEIFNVLYLDAEENQYDPDKEWDSGTIEQVAQAFSDRGFVAQEEV